MSIMTGVLWMVCPRASPTKLAAAHSNITDDAIIDTVNGAQPALQ